MAKKKNQIFYMTVSIASLVYVMQRPCRSQTNDYKSTNQLHRFLT